MLNNCFSEAVGELLVRSGRETYPLSNLAKSRRTPCCQAFTRCFWVTKIRNILLLTKSLLTKLLLLNRFILFLFELTHKWHLLRAHSGFHRFMFVVFMVKEQTQLCINAVRTIRTKAETDEIAIKKRRDREGTPLSHCVNKYRKSTYKVFVSARYSVWTS